MSAVNEPALDGIVVTKRIKVTSDTLSAKYDPVNDFAKKERSEERELIRRDCVYPLDGVFGNDVADGKVPPNFCFPMARGRTWGRIASTSPSEEFVWRVKERM